MKNDNLTIVLLNSLSKMTTEASFTTRLMQCKITIGPNLLRKTICQSEGAQTQHG